MLTIWMLFLAIFSLNAPEPAGYDGEDEKVSKGIEEHIPKGGLMDCLQCPAYCLWGDPGKSIPK